MDREAIEEIKHHFSVAAEGLESKIELVAEGHALLRSSIVDLRTEVTSGFGDLRSMIKLSYAEIDTRITTLEHELARLRSRMDKVEAAIR